MSAIPFDIICCIGGSPAAEVASLQGWARANQGIAGARRVLLIDSAYTKEQGIGERVRAALCEVLSLDVKHITLECFSNKPCIDELMRIYTGWRGRADSENLLFCSQPGLAFLNVQFFARLPDATQIAFNEGPSVWYGRFEGGEGFKKTPIPALGVDMVLGLHAAICKAQADWPQFLAADQRAALTGFVQEHNGYCNAEVTSAAGRKTRLHGLWENRGRLFGALLADPDSDTQEIRLHARKIATLRPLQITVALISTKKNQRETWNWFGLPTATHVTKLERNPALALPHRTALSTKDEPANFQSAIAPGDHSNPVVRSTWAEALALNDVNLVCWMNEDPLVTLITIWTHRPKRCWLLYDKVHERVCRNVYRLLKHASKLPVGELRLVQSNKLAAGIDSAIPLQERTNERWIANISPGSKVHALALATLDRDGLELYSLDNSIPAAVALDTPSAANRFAKQTPPLWLTASIAGGPLRETWNAPARSEGQHPAVLAALRILVSYYREQRRNEQRYDSIPRSYRSRHGSIKLLTQGKIPENEGLVRKVRVKPQGGASRDFEWKGGAWLEQLLAHALAQLDDIEVCTGFAWDWANPHPDFSKGEIDVVAAHGGSIYVFECKTDPSEGMLDKGRAQAGNIATACFGRFAIPAVIVPWIDEDKRGRLQDNPVPVICLDELLNKDSVAATLEWLRRHPSTFKRGKEFEPIRHDR